VHRVLFADGSPRDHRAGARAFWVALTGLAALGLLGREDDAPEAGSLVGEDRDEIAFTTLRGDGELVLVGDSAIATMRLVMVDEETLERGRELLQEVEVDWQASDPTS
jgi:hypothetical protein